MKKKIIIFITILTLSIQLTGCAIFESAIQDLKGTLIGDSYNIEFYDNYGAKFLTTKGERIDLMGNYVPVETSDGDTIYELSSVVTITIDGENMETTGSTVIFEGKGLKKLADFSISEINSESNGFKDLTSVSKNINKLENQFGVSKIVVVQGQFGTPISVYGGNDVYWEIPSDLPKTTKLMIDGIPLYIHRANYVMMDTDLL